MFHMFDTEIAERYGLNAAIIFQNIAFWCEHSRANGIHYHDGNHWTFNSVKAYQELFPYLGKSQIANALDKLVSEGLIIKGNYNKMAYDRTTWYALTNMGASLFRKSDNAMSENQEMDLPKIGNGECENRKPIPDINTDEKQGYNIYSSLPDGFEDFWKVYPKHVSKLDTAKAWKSLRPNSALRAVIEADVKRKMESGGLWHGREIQYIPNAARYLRGRQWEDESGGGDADEKSDEPWWKSKPWWEWPKEEQERFERERNGSGLG